MLWRGIGRGQVADPDADMSQWVSAGNNVLGRAAITSDVPESEMLTGALGTNLVSVNMPPWQKEPRNLV